MLFINLTQHKLTGEQRKKIFEMWDVKKIMELDDLTRELPIEKLKNSPSDEYELENVASEVISFLRELEEREGKLVIHLPIGSPSFMFCLSREIMDAWFTGCDWIIVFSHTDRMSEEITQPDGSIKKITKFKFKKFVTFYPPET